MNQDIYADLSTASSRSGIHFIFTRGRPDCEDLIAMRSKVEHLPLAPQLAAEN